MSESNLQKQIMLALSQHGTTAWRNNTAQAWVGEATRITATRSVLLHPGDVVIRSARPLHAGLCVGSADLIGIHHATGKFLAVEVKAPTGRVSEPQKNFISHVVASGGLAGVARSVDDALQILGRF